MSERDNARETHQLFELFAETVDARNQHILEISPEQGDYYAKLKVLEMEMWATHARWHISVLAIHSRGR